MKTQRSPLCRSPCLPASLFGRGSRRQAQVPQQVPPPRLTWSFAGPFGKYDPGAAAARLQDLQGSLLGLPFARACCRSAISPIPAAPASPRRRPRQIAAEYKIKDIDDKGAADRAAGPPGRPFPVAVPERACGARRPTASPPPDMSTLAKARTYQRGFPWFVFDIFTQYQEHGPDYIAAYLHGLQGAAARASRCRAGGHYNEYFPGHVIAMPPPLQDGQVDYNDGAPQTVEQYAKDVAAFLMWAAEPHLVAAQAHRLPGDDLPDRARRACCTSPRRRSGRRSRRRANCAWAGPGKTRSEAHQI